MSKNVMINIENAVPPSVPHSAGIRGLGLIIRKRINQLAPSSFWMWLVGPVIAVLVTSQWFSPGYFLGGGDNFPYYFVNPALWMTRLRYAWDLTGMGGPTSLIQTAPEVLIIFVLHVFLDSSATQHAFFTLLIMAQFIGMMSFILVLLPGQRVAGLLGSIFYCFNTFNVLVVPGFIGMLEQTLIPIVGAFILRLSVRRLKARNLAAFMLVAACSGPIVTNPPAYANALGFWFLMGLYALVRNRASFQRVLLRLIVLMILFIVANAYWIPDQLNSLVGIVGNGISNFASGVDSWSFVAARSSIYNLFWFNSSWAWGIYYPFSHVYDNSIMALLIFIPSLLAFSSLLNRSVAGIVSLPASAAGLLMMFWSTGQHEPWVAINLWFSHHVPLFWLFREPGTKFQFILTAVFAPLIGYQAAWIARTIGNSLVVRNVAAGVPRVSSSVIAAITKWIVTIFFAGLLLLLGFPLVTGAVVGHVVGSNKPSGIRIPTYWSELGTYMQRHDANASVFLLPIDTQYQMGYSWGYYGADSLANEVLPNRVIPAGGEPGYITASNGSLTASILGILRGNRAQSLTPFLGALGVHYIVQRNDLNATTATLLPSQVRAVLRAQKGVSFVRSFGLLDLYAVDKAYQVPRIYAIPITKRDMEGSPAELTAHLTQVTASHLGILSTNNFPKAPNIIGLRAVQDTPTRFFVQTPALKVPYILIQAGSYHQSWHACPTTGEPSPLSCVTGGSIPARLHVPLLGFLNGWVIDRPAKAMVLDFGPQHTGDVTLIVTLGTIALLVLVTLFDWMKAARRGLVRLPNSSLIH